MSAPKVTVSIILADGTRYSRSYPRRPRYWKSAAMGLTPYGTDYRGCSFELAWIEVPAGKRPA